MDAQTNPTVAAGSSETYFLGRWTTSVVEDLSEIMADDGYTLILSIKGTAEFFRDGTSIHAAVVQCKVGGKSVLPLSAHSFAAASRYRIEGDDFIEILDMSIVHEVQAMPNRGNLVELRRMLDAVLEGICDRTPRKFTIKKLSQDKFNLVLDEQEIEYTRRS